MVVCMIQIDKIYYIGNSRELVLSTTDWTNFQTLASNFKSKFGSKSDQTIIINRRMAEFQKSLVFVSKNGVEMVEGPYEGESSAVIRQLHTSENIDCLVASSKRRMLYFSEEDMIHAINFKGTHKSASLTNQICSIVAFDDVVLVCCYSQDTRDCTFHSVNPALRSKKMMQVGPFTYPLSITSWTRRPKYHLIIWVGKKSETLVSAYKSGRLTTIQREDSCLEHPVLLMLGIKFTSNLFYTWSLIRMENRYFGLIKIIKLD